MDTIVSTVVNEVTVTGRVYRRLIDKAAKLWQRISYWTKACDVEFDDGKSAQEKVGNINGITSDFELGAQDIAASSLLTKKIKDDLNAGIINDRIQLVIQADGTLGWKKDGADAVIPFSGGSGIIGMIVAGNSLGGNNIAYNTDYISEMKITNFNTKVDLGNDKTGRIFSYNFVPKKDFKAICLADIPISGCNAQNINFGLNMPSYGIIPNYFIDVKKQDRPSGYVNRSGATNGIVLLMIEAKEYNSSKFVRSCQ